MSLSKIAKQTKVCFLEKQFSKCLGTRNVQYENLFARIVLVNVATEGDLRWKYGHFRLKTEKRQKFIWVESFDCTKST